MRAGEVVQRALRMIGVVAHDEPAQAEQVADGLALLNGMLFGWRAEGLDYDHAEMAATHDLAFDPSLHLGVAFLLAEQLAGGYEAQTPANVAIGATKWSAIIWAALAATPECAIELAALTGCQRRPRRQPETWAVTPSDTADQPAFSALWIGSPGDVRITTERGDEAVIAAPGGAYLLRPGLRVWATGTTASGIRGRT